MKKNERKVQAALGILVAKGSEGIPYPLEDALKCVGPGWADIIKKCYNLCAVHDVEIHQIKEKFGTLRFRTGIAPKRVREAIRLVGK